MKTCFGRFIGGWTLGIGSLLAAVLLAQCGSSSTVKRAGNTGGSGGRQRGDGSVWWSTGGSGNTGFGDSSYDSSGFDTGTSSNTGGMLNITPIVVGIDGSVLKIACDPGTLAVSGTPKTAQCYVELPDGSHATDVVWNTDDTRVGSIGQDGIFRANGFVGGVVKVTGTVAGNTRATIEVTVDVSIQSNVGGVSAADIGKLIAGGSSDAQFKWLYPYDMTVFPRGLQAPELQFAGACADASYLKITLPHFTYEQAAKETAPLKVTFPDDAWKAAQLSTAGSDLMNVSVTKMCGGQVTGPKTEQWITAPGKLKGVVYYTTYRPNIEALRLIIGATAQSLIPDCGAACHSVSANGEVLANATGTFDLTSGAVPPPQMASPSDERFDYAGLTYDGNRALSIGTDPGRLDKAPSPGSSDLLDTSSGNVVKGGLPTYWTPSFSPDSKYVAYTNLDQGDGHLGVMNYNGTGFSGGRDVKVDNGKSLGWASFLPDSLGVVYHEGDRFSTAGTAELRLIQVN
ncbi:MAG TPA: hypothetical protein VGJ84_05025, partial [Polyangiaceae bacterium]